MHHSDICMHLVLISLVFVFVFPPCSEVRTQTVEASAVKPPLKELVGMFYWHHFAFTQFYFVWGGYYLWGFFCLF